MLGMTSKAGLSIEETGVRYARLKGKNREIDKQFFLPMPHGALEDQQLADSELLAAQLKEAVKRERLRGTWVSISVPPSQIVIRKMTIPGANPKQLEQLVRLEVETGLHLPFDNPVYDYIELSRNESEAELLIIAAPRQIIEEYVNLVESAGLKVSSVEVTGTALARLIELGGEHLFSSGMLIDLDHAILDVCMFHERNPVFMRTLNLKEQSREDMNAWQESAAAADMTLGRDREGEDLSYAQTVEITAEISRMLNFYQYSLHEGAVRIQDIFVTGSPEVRRQLVEVLKTSFSEIQIHEIDFSSPKEAAAANQLVDYNDYRLAAGAALRTSGGLKINLLPVEDREAVIFPFLAVSLLVFWLLGLAATGTIMVMNQGKISNQDERLEGLASQRNTLEQELLALNRSGMGQNGRAAAVEGIREHRESPAAMMSAIVKPMPEGGILRDLGYTYRSEIGMTVYLPQMEQAAEYLVLLRRLPFTNGAMITKLTEGISGGNSGNPQGQGYYTAVYRISLGSGTSIANLPAEGEEEDDGAAE
ncbi:pilus assembly protein PilM [Paenibacillus lemnae]|uniref:Pilus assembly protein PilM n=1 Tax=Paenibacillus lemnae TaxID=1330551 RepID=A0A848M6Q7_PAELE|nr:pilus assembly protein PilM [Paenibacillus lemnae]NMO96667.1 pilus assembly protein PilM [Paenibacillus lemnae]